VIQSKRATLVFHFCVGLSDVDSSAPLAETDVVQDFHLINGCQVLLSPGEEFGFRLDGVLVSDHRVPAVPTEGNDIELLPAPVEGHSGLCKTFYKAEYAVWLGQGEHFNSSLLGWQRVLFGGERWGLTPVSYDGEPRRLEFLASTPKDSSYFNWCDGEFREFDSFEELVEAAMGLAV
jgi:hypothetical protein